MRPPTTTKRYFPALLCVLSMALFGTGWMPAYGQSSSVPQLFQQIQRQANQLNTDTTQMATFANSKLSWQSHAAQIDKVKRHVNHAGQLLAKLHDARQSAEPWQQHVIDRITPLLQEMDSNTTRIIHRLNDRTQPWRPQYRDYIQLNAQLANQLSKLITDSINYGNAQSKSDKLGKTLGFSES